MAPSLRRTALFALYQCTIALGIALLPIALVARRAGVPVPLHHLVRRLGDAYAHAE